MVVLLFEASLEQGPISWDDLYAEMDNVEGFTELLYVHADGAAWPTMGDLVRQNKRIIVFHFNGDQCAEDDAPCPPGYHYFYDHAAETRFDSASLGDLENGEVSCEVTRGPRGEDGPAAFFVVNNFVTPPDEDASAVANSKDFLGKRLTDCSNRNSMRPNFVYLDFWSRGVTAQVSASLSPLPSAVLSQTDSTFRLISLVLNTLPILRFPIQLVQLANEQHAQQSSQ